MTDRYTLSLGGLRVGWESPPRAAALVSLAGDLDSLSIPVLQQALDAIYAEACHDIRLELGALEFIDSSGLGALVGAWRYCHERGGTVIACNPRAPVRRLMDMTGIAPMLLGGN